MLKRGKIFYVAAIIAAFICTDSAIAESGGKGSNVFIANTISARGLPREGASYAAELHYRYYFSDSDNILWQNSHIGFGVGDSISPATNSAGAFIEFEPLAILNVRLQYEYMHFFGEFTALLNFPDKDSDYSDDVLDDLQDDDEAEWASGHHYSVKPTFQAMYKRFVLLNMASFDWYDIDKDNYFYLPTDDILVKTDDYMFTNSTIAGVIFWKRSESEMAILGSRYTYMRVDSTNRQRQELDGVLVWMMGDNKWFMDKPTLMLAAGGYLEDRYREQDAFVGGIFSFNYTLLDRGK